MSKQHLFSVTRKDLDVQHFCCGGKGGQKQNKTASGTRIVHRASGAVGESREERSQAQNTKTAFRRMAESKTFKAWLRLEASARVKGFADTEAMVDKMMQPQYLKVEYLGGEECESSNKQG